MSDRRAVGHHLERVVEAAVGLHRNHSHGLGDNIDVSRAWIVEHASKRTTRHGPAGQEGSVGPRRSVLALLSDRTNPSSFRCCAKNGSHGSVRPYADPVISQPSLLQARWRGRVLGIRFAPPARPVSTVRRSTHCGVDWMPRDTALGAAAGPWHSLYLTGRGILPTRALSRTTSTRPRRTYADLAHLFSPVSGERETAPHRRGTRYGALSGLREVLVGNLRAVERSRR